MAKQQVPRVRQKNILPEQAEVTSNADDALEALAALFSDPKLVRRGRFRYPVDGQKDEIERAFDAAMEEAFGPDKEYENWVRRLYKLGLVIDRKGGE